MASSYTTDQMLASLKRRGLIPTSDEILTDADLLALVNEELFSYVMGFLVSVREEYGVAEEDVAVAADTAAYPIPSRASAAGLRDVLYRASSEAAFTPLARTEPETADRDGYELRGNQIVLVPTPTATGTLRFRYHRRPNRCVLAASAAQITSLDTGTRTVNFDANEALVWSVEVGSTFDFIKGTSGFEHRGIDYTPSSMDTESGYVVFNEALPDGLAVGDWVALAEESPIPQIPVEFHPLLAQRVTAKALEALGSSKSQLAYERADRIQKELMPLMTPRVKGASHVLINRNAPGFGYGAKYAFRRRR